VSLSPSLIFLWPSTAGTIPSGWARETVLDGLYPFVTDSASDDAGTVGGFSTHDHVIIGHRHGISGGAAVGTTTENNGGSTYNLATATHTHANKLSSLSSASVTGSTTNNPVHIDVIFIKPADGARIGVPNGAWAFCDTLPTGWSVASDAVDKFIRGAVASGDANLTPSGTNTHTHTDLHEHATRSSSAATGTTSKVYGNSITAPPGANASHFHNVYLDFNDPGMGDSGVDDLPSWEKLAVVQNDTGSPSIPTGLLALYLGLVANIPTGWERFDLTAGYEFLLGSALVDVGTVGGGSLQGGILYYTHTHTPVAHDHAPSAGSASDLKGDFLVSSPSVAVDSHEHTWTVASVANIIGDSSVRGIYPPWIKVLLLRFLGAVAPPGVDVTLECVHTP
jgi:hypothetical protein